MFKTRLLSGIVLVILVIGVLYLGGYVTAGAMLLLSLGGVFELLRIYKLHKTPIGVATYVATVIYYGLLIFDKNEFVLPLIILFVLTVLGIYVTTYPRFTDKDAMAAVLSFMYVTLMLSYMYLIRDLEHGGALVVMVFVCSWVNDTCAYCVGVTLGKHKMTPKLSPKKSLEGCFGGVLGAALIGGLYGFFVVEKQLPGQNISWIIAFICAVAAAAIGAILFPVEEEVAD